MTESKSSKSALAFSRRIKWILIAAGVLILVASVGQYTYTFWQNTQVKPVTRVGLKPMDPQAILHATATHAAPVSTVPETQISVAKQAPPLSSINNSRPGTTSLNLKTSDVQTVNGVTVEASNFRVKNNDLLADFCYPVSGDSQDWAIDFPTLAVDGRTIQAYGVHYSDPTQTQRCATASFQLPALPDLSDFAITLQQLQTAGAEQPDCDKAQAKLDAQNTGIVIKCHYAETYFPGAEIVKHPASLTSEQVDKLVMDSFVETVTGPWIFKGSLATH